MFVENDLRPLFRLEGSGIGCCLKFTDYGVFCVNTLLLKALPLNGALLRAQSAFRREKLACR